MEKSTIIRAWKDPIFRAGLEGEELALIPPNPAGPAFTDVPEAELVCWTFAVTCRWPGCDASDSLRRRQHQVLGPDLHAHERVKVSYGGVADVPRVDRADGVAQPRVGVEPEAE